LHQPTTALRQAPPDEAGMRAEILCQLFDLSPAEPREIPQELDRAAAQPVSPERKAAT
jgi:hypothetical protein